MTVEAEIISKLVHLEGRPSALKRSKVEIRILIALFACVRLIPNFWQ